MMRLIGLLKRISRRENILKVSQDEEMWNVQFANGSWNFMLNVEKRIELTPIINLCLEKAKSRPYALLDVGCGNGVLASVLAHEPSIEYHGLDISSKALELARKNNPNALFYQSTAENPPSFTRQFDVMIFNEVLYYTAVSVVLEKSRRFLAKDGIVIVAMYDSWRTKFLWFIVSRYIIFYKKDVVRRDKKGQKWIIKMGTFKS